MSKNSKRKSQKTDTREKTNENKHDLMKTNRNEVTLWND